MDERAQSNATSPPGLLLFALGMARVPPKKPLPGPVLVRLLIELGMSEAAARSTILRLRRGGWLTSKRIGRMVGYAPSPAMVVGHERRAGQLAASRTTWDGRFHALLVSVPEADRAFRDSLRRAAIVAGYRMLRPGLFIAPDNRSEELGPVFARVPRRATVTSAYLELSAADARRVAWDLWAVGELVARSRHAAAQATAAIARQGTNAPVGARAVRTLAAATLPIYAAVADDPGLPTTLLPTDWPSADLKVALDAALQTFMPAVDEYIDQLRKQSGQ